jgi:hypothetical protein
MHQQLASAASGKNAYYPVPPASFSTHASIRSTSSMKFPAKLGSVPILKLQVDEQLLGIVLHGSLTSLKKKYRGRAC